MQLSSGADVALADLLVQLRRAGYAFVTPTPGTHARVVARAGKDVARNLRDIFGWSLPFDPALWFVARHGEEIVGFCLGFRRNWKGAPDGYVSDLGVRPARRGGGLGFALLTTVLAALAARELPTATLDTDADNLTGALRLYRKAGMTATPLATEWTKPLAG